MNIKVRREIIRCSRCKRKNEFLYLSDFSYGERLLLFDGGTKYAYINLLEDDVYADFIKKVSSILDLYQKVVSEQYFQDIIDQLFPITFDKIQGSEVELSQNCKKCLYCTSEKFEDLLVEPETILCVELPNITHYTWQCKDDEKKTKLIEHSLRKLNII